MPDENESRTRISRRTKVFEALDYLAEGLHIFAEQQLRQAFPATWQENVSRVDGHPTNLLDPYVLLATMKDKWNRAFEPKLKGAVPRRVVEELYDARNAMSHGGSFTAEAVDNSISSMLRLLKNIPQSEASIKAADCIEKLRHQRISADNSALVVEPIVNASAEEYADTPQTQVTASLDQAEAVAGGTQSDEQLPIENTQQSEQPPFSSIASTGESVPAVTYNFSRLCFKANQIEPLQDDQAFRVVTPVGTFQMTKAEFYQAFPKVIVSKSYAENGIYHYPSVPKSALPYKLSE